MVPHKIMVVDDNAATRRMVRNALTRSGHNVIEAADGASARALMSAEHPTLVIQDLMLPDADGFALVGELRSLAGASRVSILAFSGFVSKQDEARATTVGFDDIITKPITPARLVPLIEAHLLMSTGSLEPFGTGHRLLIVDDDPLQLKLAAFRLGRLGFEIESVENGEQALTAVRKSPPTAIVSDVMMPELDGFGLALALRQDPALRSLPLLLVTSSYIEPSDRELAKRAGASELVLRTPDLSELVSVLQTTLADRPAPPPRPSAEELPALELDRSRRVARQLERQVALNSGLAQRCSALASELTVLNGISETVLKHRDVDVALDEALAQCFDAGGISIGAIYLLEPDGSLRARPIGGDAAWAAPDLAAFATATPFFGREGVLRDLMRTGRPLYVSETEPAAEVGDLLARCHATAIFLIPLVHVGSPLGVLMMGSQRRELEEDDWRAFALGVGNQLSQVLSVAHAYAQRTEAERRATQHAAVLNAVVDSAPDFVLQIELDGRIKLSNRGWCDADATQVVGTNWFDYMALDQQEVPRAALATMLRTGEPIGYEISTRSATGALSWFAVRLGPIREEGKVVGAVLIARDVSDRKQTEMQLMVSDRMASVGTLAAGVAHEINNPLASVIANLDMALSDVLALGESVTLPAELADEIKDARSAADRVRQIVRDLKIFSRAEEDSRGPVDVEHVLDSTLRMAWNELRHRAKIVKKYSGVRAVDANDSRLGQVFLNLIVNAVHALPERNYAHNEIRLTTEMVGARVNITIADTGAGIPPEIQKRLFTPFFTTKPVGVGTGLGLAISHRIVSSFGGTLTFETEVGKGTAFKVSLPVARGDTAPMPVRTTKRTDSSRRGRVLVIDDEETVAQTMRRSLSTAHDVTVLTSARAAIELIKSGQRFDVILCDLMMPEVTGMELHAELSRSQPEQAARLVFVTGGAFTIAAREFLDVVPNRRLEKPFDLRTLRELVAELMPPA